MRGFRLAYASSKLGIGALVNYTVVGRVLRLRLGLQFSMLGLWFPRLLSLAAVLWFLLDVDMSPCRMCDVGLLRASLWYRPATRVF